MDRPARKIALAVALVAAGSAGSGHGMQATTPQPTATLLTRSTTTVTGQNIGLPQGAVEVVITRTVIPAGGTLPMHKHPWPRYAIVESGRLRVHWELAGLTREFGPGDAVIEAIDQWHEGAALGPEAVRLIVVDQVPPGATNLVRR